MYKHIILILFLSHSILAADLDNSGFAPFTMRGCGDTVNIYKNIPDGTGKMIFHADWNYSGATLYPGALLGNRLNMSATNVFGGKVYDVLFFTEALTVKERNKLYSDIKIKHPDIINL